MTIKQKSFLKKIFKAKKIGKKAFEKKKLRFNQKNFFEKTLQIRRVIKVVKGGRRLSFRAILAIGDKKKRIGVGIGKGSNVPLALEKAKIAAKKNLIRVPITFAKSIPHLITSSFGASTVMLKPASRGTGVIAGSSVRAILELSGLQNVLSKELGSNSILNNALATVKALQSISREVWYSKALSKKKRELYKRLFKKY